MNFSELVLRLALSFICLLLLTRLMGRKEISQMTFFNFVSAIALGTLGASLAIESSLKISTGVIALIGWSLFTILMGYIDLKSKTMRNLINGDPIIIIQKGKVIDKELKKTRLDHNALKVLLRKKDVFQFSEVDYAIFETDGTLSVLKKDAAQPVTKAESGYYPKNVIPMATAVISNGEILNENLSELNLNEPWLLQELANKGINSIEKVFYAEVQKNGSLYVDKIMDEQ
ncbi:YetF domain-containing protein [Falsibacillus albus]|uniref:DUF421 domain-containing protein n=1 Tax=Falsibacillus albus TaxID=2478915 RepID=A0A3L7JTV1_9BACI|nr:DUF421 domain-containing protein [Falsibacillus albus]RLQ93694.1 DUF421 domain-containing protein [Falsibacillus albus]